LVGTEPHPKVLTQPLWFYIPVVAGLHPLAHSLLHLIGWNGIAKDCVIDVFLEAFDNLWSCVILHISNGKRWNTRSYIRINVIHDVPFSRTSASAINA